MYVRRSSLYATELPLTFSSCSRTVGRQPPASLVAAARACAHSLSAPLCVEEEEVEDQCLTLTFAQSRLPLTFLAVKETSAQQPSNPQ